MRRTFEIKLRVFVAGKSFEFYDLIYQDGFEELDVGTVSIAVPEASDVALTDFGGKWRVVCPDPAFPDDPSKNFKTKAFSITESDEDIQFYIDKYIPHLTFKQRVYRPQYTDYWNHARD